MGVAVAGQVWCAWSLEGASLLQLVLSRCCAAVVHKVYLNRQGRLGLGAQHLQSRGERTGAADSSVSHFEGQGGAGMGCSSVGSIATCRRMGVNCNVLIWFCWCFD